MILGDFRDGAKNHRFLCLLKSIKELNQSDF